MPETLINSGMTWTVIDAYRRPDGWWRVLIEMPGKDPFAIWRETWP